MAVKIIRSCDLCNEDAGEDESHLITDEQSEVLVKDGTDNSLFVFKSLTNYICYSCSKLRISRNALVGRRVELAIYT